MISNRTWSKKNDAPLNSPTPTLISHCVMLRIINSFHLHLLQRDACTLNYVCKTYVYRWPARAGHKWEKYGVSGRVWSGGWLATSYIADAVYEWCILCMYYDRGKSYSSCFVSIIIYNNKIDILCCFVVIISQFQLMLLNQASIMQYSIA